MVWCNLVSGWSTSQDSGEATQSWTIKNHEIPGLELHQYEKKHRNEGKQIKNYGVIAPYTLYIFWDREHSVFCSTWVQLSFVFVWCGDQPLFGQWFSFVAIKMCTGFFFTRGKMVLTVKSVLVKTGPTVLVAIAM